MESSTQDFATELESLRTSTGELTGGVETLKQEQDTRNNQERAALLDAIRPVLDSIQAARVFLLETWSSPQDAAHPPSEIVTAETSIASVRRHVSDVSEHLNTLQTAATARLSTVETFRNKWMEHGAVALRLQDQTNQLLKTGEENIRGLQVLLDEKQSSLQNIAHTIGAKEGEIAHQRYLADRAKKDRNAALIVSVQSFRIGNSAANKPGLVYVRRVASSPSSSPLQVPSPPRASAVSSRCKSVQS